MKVISKVHRKANGTEPTAIKPAMNNFGIERPIAIGDIVPDGDQPRQHFDPEKQAKLRESLRTHGQLYPLLVYHDAMIDKYIIIDGERRFRAADHEGLPSLRCCVVEKPATREDIVVMQLAANDQREPLTPCEEASSYAAIMITTGWSGAELAKRLAVSEVHVSKRLSLLKLDYRVQRFVDNGKIGPTIGYEISRLASHVEQCELALQVIDNGWTREMVVQEIKARDEAKQLPGQKDLPMPDAPPRNVSSVPGDLKLLNEPAERPRPAPEAVQPKTTEPEIEDKKAVQESPKQGDMIKAAGWKQKAYAGLSRFVFEGDPLCEIQLDLPYGMGWNQLVAVMGNAYHAALKASKEAS